MTDNWYIVLELEFDPPCEDETVITKRIDEKAKFWSTHFNDFKMGAQYRTWHLNIGQIKKEMLGPANIRKQLAKDACSLVYGPVDKMLKMIGRKGHITADEVEKLSKKQNISKEVIRKRAAALGLQERGNSVNYQNIYDKYYKSKPQNTATFDGLKALLDTFHQENLYDFLYAGMKVKDANRLPCDKLCQRADEKKKNEFYKNDNISGTGAKLCAQCKLTFKDDASKAAYDNYLEYIKRKIVLDEAKNIAEISGELDTEQFEAFTGQLTQLFRGRKLAENVLTAFCKIEKIAYKSSSPETHAKIKVCRCGCTNDVSDGRKICHQCGLELTIRCPQCGTENDANIRICKCDFNFDNLDKAIALCEQAELAINELDFKAAAAHLADAGRYWPKSGRVAELQKKLNEFQKRVGGEVNKLRTAMQSKRYIEAQQQYAGIQRLFPGYADKTIETEISQAVSSAQASFQRAQSAKTETEVLELCARAYDICSDLPGVKELLAEYPPSPVKGFSVSVNPNIRGNIISWNVNANDKSTRYVVVKSSTGWVQHMADGKEIFRGSASSYCDKDIEPGVAYYYNVFADRAGIQSRGAEGDFKEVVNLFELSTLSVTPGEGSLNLMWGTLPHNATAEIYQQMGSGEKHISSSLSDRHLISDLSNDTPYHFRVALSYMVNGKKVETKGIQVSGTPTCPPMPVDTLQVKPLQGDLYKAVWQRPEQGNVRLFCSTQKPAHHTGDLVSLAVLEQEMRSLQQRALPASAAQELKPDESGTAFEYSGTELLYVTAVVVKSDSAVFGSLARISKGGSVHVREIRFRPGHRGIPILKSFSRMRRHSLGISCVWVRNPVIKSIRGV